MEIYTFKFLKEGLEEVLDQVKATVLIDLVHGGLLAMDVAEDYAMKNTVILKKKHFFRTLTSKWKKTPESNYYMLVVGSDHISSTVEETSSGKKGVLMSMLNKVLRENFDPTLSGGEDCPEPPPKRLVSP